METTHTPTWTAGQVFAGYTIIRVLGAGGMGTVYLAAHPRLPREDALKVLPAHWTADPEYRARFEREAELAAGLSHPHIVGVQDRGEFDGHFWLSMDYVAGTDADRLLRERFSGGMPLTEALPIISAVGSALDYAHHRGLLHRDVKPANILLTDADGQPRRIYLADFGIARRMDDAARLTATNMVVGTVSYAAPEQLKGEQVDGRTDQYALACTAFHLLTGAAPYGDSNPGVVIARHVNAPPPSIGAIRPELAALDWVFAKAMAKQPADRFASCQEFADQLALHPATRFAYAAELPTNGFTHPTQIAPPILPFPTTSRINRKPRRTRILAAALSGVALLVAGGVVTGLRLTDSHPPSAAPTPSTAAPTTPAPPPNTGPMTGTYQVEFSAPIGVDGKTSPLARPATEVWTVRSVCRPQGCVATAARVSGDAMQVPTMVLDEVDGRWISTSVGTTTCGKAEGEVWESFALQAVPGGTFSGEATETMSLGCANKRTVTFTRTGDADLGKLPDPVALPARTVSPAAGMHGRYHQTVTQANGFKDERDWAVRTDCLRTADRCLTFFHIPPANALVLLFGDGKWTYESEFDARCSKGGVARLKISAQFPLPQSVQDPIDVLGGHGREDATGSRCPSTDIEMSFTRIGD